MKNLGSELSEEENELRNLRGNGGILFFLKDEALSTLR
jgi:hypothetical protein